MHVASNVLTRISEQEALFHLHINVLLGVQWYRFNNKNLTSIAMNIVSYKSQFFDRRNRGYENKRLLCII